MRDPVVGVVFLLTIGMLHVVAFVALQRAMYRLAGITPTEPERRRLTVGFVGLVVVNVLLALFAAFGVPLWWGVLGLLSVFLAAWALLRSRKHWLVMLSPDEQALLPARRATMRAFVRTRPFGLLTGAYVLLYPIFLIASVLLILSLLR